MKRRKRRKRTNAKIPAKGRLRYFADRLWSLAVRSRWNWRCAVCGKNKTQAHHLIPRQHEAVRYSLLNGIALCASCHKFDKDISPHQNAAGWMIWLRTNHRGLHHRCSSDPSPQFHGVKNAAYYLSVIRLLSMHVEDEQFRKIVGVKLSEHLK